MQPPLYPFIHTTYPILISPFFHSSISPISQPDTYSQEVRKETRTRSKKPGKTIYLTPAMIHPQILRNCTSQRTQSGFHISHTHHSQGSMHKTDSPTSTSITSQPCVLGHERKIDVANSQHHCSRLSLASRVTNII